jgi:hypothetical protein
MRCDPRRDRDANQRPEDPLATRLGHAIFAPQSGARWYGAFPWRETMLSANTAGRSVHLDEEAVYASAHKDWI